MEGFGVMIQLLAMLVLGFVLGFILGRMGPEKEKWLKEFRR